MARPYGTNSDKPSAPPPTSARTRSTRSQSREASVQPPENKQPKKRRRAKVAEPELNTVDEDAVIEEQLADTAQDEAAAAAAAAEDGDEDDEPRRESGHSAISGTTAKTSFSQEEIADLDADIMVDVLPNLVAAADQLSALLVPADPKVRPVIWKEIRVQGSKQNKLFNNRIASINAHKDSFGNQTYILPSIVLRAFFKVQHLEDVPEGPWRPDSLLYKINMAQMLRTLLVEIVDPLNISVTAWQDLEHLETYFPRAISGHAFDMEAVKTCLGIQTQLAIARLQAYSDSPNFSPAQTVKDTFFASDIDGEFVYKFIESLSLNQMDPDDNKMMETVFDNMLAPFEAGYDGDIAHAISLLRSQYPWDSFVDQVVRYFQSRQAQLEQSIAAAGGRDSIVSSLTEELQQREADREFMMKRESLTAIGATPKKGFGAKALRERRQRRSMQAPPQTAPVAQMVAEPIDQQPAATAPAADDYAVRQEGEDDESEPTAPERARTTLAQLAGFQSLQMQNASKGKQRMIDRQPTAQRVEFDSQEDGSQLQRPQASARPPATQTRNKRPHSEVDDEPEDFEPTQDEGFQVDQRDTTAADARRRAAEASHTGASRRQPRSQTADYDIPASASGSPSRRPAQAPKRRRKNPGSTFPDIPRPTADDPVEAGDYDFQRAKDLAKLNRITASQNKPTQVRTPWNEEEESALIELIVQHGGEGVSYASLKKQADGEGILTRRRAEDMRFKARNMKLTFLLAGVPLPENWDNVVLDKKAIEKLHARGIHYTQARIRNSGADYE